MLSRLKTVAALTVFAAVAATSGAAIAGTPANTKAAPEFTGIETWINSDPLTLSQLRGKVVLVDFWTYSCINCIHTLPQVQSWNQKFKDQGLVVVGVHTPEFPTWRAYDNQYWPAFYLIDKKGQVAYSHFGEGDYAQTENAIKALLAQK
jgi:thiol-disulfide isomerase/thioredoxin